MNIKKLSQKPKVFERLLGLSPQKFTQLAQELEPLWQKAELARKTKHKRYRKVGGGNAYKLAFAEMLAMHLIYMRTYTTHVFLGMIFGIDDSRVCRYFRKLQPVLYCRMRSVTIKKIDIPEEEILGLIVDATEQETERRTGSGYSGKKRRQTIKTQVVADRKAKIRHVSCSVPGNMHDKKLFDRTGLVLPANTRADLGYLGTNLSLPQKASKLHPLTEKQKRANKRHASVRIAIEHVFASLKQFRILAQRWRSALSGYHQTFTIVAGLYNLRRA